MNATALLRLAAVMLLAGCAAEPFAFDEHRARAIDVVLKSTLPDFKEYRIRIDDGNWHRSDKTFVWNLRPGANRLEARAIGKSGFEGPISSIVLE